MFKRVPLSEEEEAAVEGTFRFYKPGLLAKTYLVEQNGKISEDWYTLPKNMDLEHLKNFKIYPDDIWIVTPPKSGTTWIQEIVWLMLNNVDTKAANEQCQFYRVPFLDFGPMTKSEEHINPMEYPEGLEKNFENLQTFTSHSVGYAGHLKRPRIIKSHLPLKYLSDDLNNAKVIFVARNLKDACVSFYYHLKLFNLPDGSSLTLPFETHSRNYKNGIAIMTPILPMIFDAWERQKQNKNLLFLTYEEMIQDIDRQITRIKDFLGVTLTETQLAKLKDAVSFNAMRKNPSVNKIYELPYDPKNGSSFIRNGKVGDWKTHFDEEMMAEWDKWLEDEFKKTDLKMIYEL